MARLFIAVEVPPAQAAGLLSTLPPAPGVRAATPAQVHLTLHFLGEGLGEAAPAADLLDAALAALRTPAFTLQTYGTGRFRSGPGSVLWAGLAPGPGLDTLRALHAEVGQALAQAAGFPPERRRFHPHVTLARCKPIVPEGALRAWLDAHRTLASAPWRVARLVLFESRLGPHGPQHLLRQAWPLTAPEPTPGC
ncbi:RNA 2',3'-cyclic phosphodiesterase [Cupriavidus taiwanensis]|uniref:RNA 2',3'-cyclic phosphodiesterase n=1 Tax=Cupriavidus taiwanensis TaxID=164546 RepID=UPI000E107EB4|nr:RNA 2',3'-cyclic phosphodiesterase [Cupriavidus taiwanensis]SOY59578.1 Putative 2',5' RNA ligase [Cupriavidus taiwanensis]SOY59971.1 Putative 2',5' RNA ligase [Cupriavidus taiwanensis]SOY92048.1 Putative 2',5' RNA ligase [Cupriavidus taiwanensis]SOZ65876.1 Putative 2',5' RNA ligase [Cupriavidus taiwanensis]SOZ83558.1 Putative 2',5' RNA ligase [Cupriavidus taiwanensis]